MGISGGYLELARCWPAREGRERGSVGDAPGASPAPSSIPGSTRGHCGIWATPGSPPRGSRAPSRARIGRIGRRWKRREPAPDRPRPARHRRLRPGSPRTGRGRVPKLLPPSRGVPPALENPETPTHSPAFPCPRCLLD